MLQNPVISLLTRKLLHHIPLVLQVFQVQLTMLCRLAGLVHVFYCSQFESRSMVSGAWSMLRFFLIRGRIVPILQRIRCVRWVQNGLMHSPCLTLLLGLVIPVWVNYATFTMLYWKVHKVLAIPCIARRFLWYVRQLIVLRCLPTWCQHLVSCSLLTLWYRSGGQGWYCYRTRFLLEVCAAPDYQQRWWAIDGTMYSIWMDVVR